ncbi:hypothetical protein THASP1DRAFT_32327 [Thamnocephalis sphaerospora]|uniref:RRM domain-containing protein n=1 Tax=Thamnocephalis sphaerospora TaxID=78915 RepID=A0A4V1IW01_9FUNG|nr:hypothetical protein THASP1DRAFT_32327 [Thamnocephalis sphaerospora]|eukprot:RKP05839.1 hypothetical protein THASP1DRAFT_32327 [Thamnocephalis sphaerospora]
MLLSPPLMQKQVVSMDRTYFDIGDVNKICKRTVVVKNLPESVTESCLYDEFAKHGTIERLTLIRNSDLLRVYAFIRYATAVPVEHAIRARNGTCMFSQMMQNRGALLP